MSVSPARSHLRATMRFAAATLLAAGMLMAPAASASATAVPGCAAGVKVDSDASPATVTVSGTPVEVTIAGTGFAITQAGGGALADATWCLKASTRTQTGSGTTGTSTITNKKGVPQDIGYLVVYSVSTPCTDGAMRVHGTGFDTCAQGVWVYRDCAPGTVAVQIGPDLIVCDWPTP